MSKPATPAPASPPLPTRRQLDELEALLQRMLELPVRQEQEAILTRREPPEIARDDFDESPTEWPEPTSDAAPADTTSTICPPPAPAYPDWESRIDSPRFLFENSPGAEPAWDEPDSVVAERDTGSERGERGLIDATADEWPREPLQREPGVFRILLGWAGLVCLVISLAILLLDWYGWTW